MQVTSLSHLLTIRSSRRWCLHREIFAATHAFARSAQLARLNNLRHSETGHEACTDLGSHEADDNGKCRAVGLTYGLNSRYPSPVLEMQKSRKGTLTSETFSSLTSQTTRRFVPFHFGCVLKLFRAVHLDFQNGRFSVKESAGFANQVI